jgi:hypothetical protein
MKECASPTKLIVMTVGHSTRTSKEFIHLLKANQVRRTVTRLRHYPRTGNLLDEMAVVVAITSSLIELKSVLQKNNGKDRHQ